LAALAEDVAVDPVYTIVTPTFEHAASIDDYLQATTTAASLPFDWIIVDDASQDGTVDRVEQWLRERPHPLVARVVIERSPVPVYETACDNIGFRIARTEVIIEVQADIQIREPAFDALMLRALETTPEPSAISGRCGHTFAWLKPRSPLRALFGRRTRDVVGLCGKRIETPEIIEPIRGQIFRCETVNRGPWLVLKSDLERRGYLDQRHFFLGNDDHDYHRRVFEADGRRPLYVPMRLSSPLGLGAVRRRRSGINKEVFEKLRAEKRGSPEFHRFLASLSSSAPPVRIV
jgi:glycosyltransferase involved in cell wall biosynthesis